MKACMAMSIARLRPSAQRPPQEPLVDTPRDRAAAFDDDHRNLVLVALEDGKIGGDVDGRDVHLEGGGTVAGRSPAAHRSYSLATHSGATLAVALTWPAP